MVDGVRVISVTRLLEQATDRLQQRETQKDPRRRAPRRGLPATNLTMWIFSFGLIRAIMQIGVCSQASSRFFLYTFEKRRPGASNSATVASKVNASRRKSDAGRDRGSSPGYPTNG